jgi:hypothetical protein
LKLAILFVFVLTFELYFDFFNFAFGYGFFCRPEQLAVCTPTSLDDHRHTSSTLITQDLFALNILKTLIFQPCLSHVYKFTSFGISFNRFDLDLLTLYVMMPYYISSKATFSESECQCQ